MVNIVSGTGCNACYVENVENAEVFNGDRSKPYVIINTEWGNLGAKGELDDIFTEYDRQVDVESLNPGKQRYVLDAIIEWLSRKYYKNVSNGIITIANDFFEKVTGSLSRVQ